MLLLLAAACLQNVDARQADPSAACLATLIPEGERIVAEADKAFQKHARALKKAYARHDIASAGDVHAPSGHPSLPSLIQFLQPDAARNGLIEDVVNSLNATDFSPGSGNKCPPVERVRDAYDSNLEKYAGILEETLEVLTNRLDADALKPDEGLWLAVIQTEASISSAQVTKDGSFVGGGHRFFEIAPGNYLRLVPMKAGSYKWNRLQWGTNRFFIYINLADDDMTFEIEPGKLNYTGILDIKYEGDRAFDVNLRDRLTIVISLLEERMPDVLTSFDIANGLETDDEFLDFYLQETGLTGSEGSAQ